MAIPPYSPHAFFRNIPHDLLANYFEQKRIPLDLDWTKLKGKNKSAETIFKAIIKLPEAEQARIEVDFQNINALACDGGIYALNNGALLAGNDTFRKGMADIDGLHAKSMWAFLQQTNYWRAASSLLHAQSVSAGRWDQLRGFPPVPPKVEPNDLKKLEKRISCHFRERAGKGRRCQVEAYRDMETSKEYFFAYPEDYGQINQVWTQEKLQPLTTHPAFEVIFVYSQKDGFIDIYAPKNTKSVPELRKIFAGVILDLEVLPDGTANQKSYDLTPLHDKQLEFNVDDVPEIEDMHVIRLRLTLKNDKSKKIILEANDKRNPMAVYDLLGSITLPGYDITQTTIRVLIAGIGGKKQAYKDIRITPPGTCNLNHDGFDGKIRDVLAASGIEQRIQHKVETV